MVELEQFLAPKLCSSSIYVEASIGADKVGSQKVANQMLNDTAK